MSLEENNYNVSTARIIAVQKYKHKYIMLGLFFGLLCLMAIAISTNHARAALPVCDGALNGYVMPDTDDLLKFCDGTDWILLGLNAGDSAASKWNTDGASNLYYDLNNVGIDDNNPTAQMQINGAINVDGTIHSDQAIIGARGLQLSALVTDEDCLGSDDYGNMRYNAAINKIEVCAGYTWIDSAGPEWSDGLIGESQILEPSVTEAGAEFGNYLDMRNNTAVIAAHKEDAGGTDRGAAYIFVRNNEGVWSEQQRLTASDGADNDQFGRGVHINDEDLFITSRLSGNETIPQTAIYYFKRSGSNWGQIQKILPPSGSGSSFGFHSRIATLNSSELFIGDTSTDAQSGSTYRYTKSNGFWVYQNEITPEVRKTNSSFGSSIATHKNLIAISAPFDDTQSTDNGAVYIFEKQGNQWQEIQILYSNNLQTNLNFGGGSIDLNGNILIIAAINEDETTPSKGLLYIYEWNVSEFSLKQKINDQNYNDPSYDCFGRSANIIDNNTIIAGRCGGNNDKLGRAFLINKHANIWSASKELYGLTETHGGFSTTIGAESGDILIGADNSNKNGTASGLVFVFSKAESNGNPWYGALPLMEETKHVPATLTANDMNYTDRADTMDMNEDSIVAGAALDGTNGTNAGAMYIYTRSGTAWSESAKILEPTPALNNQFGRAVAMSKTHMVVASLHNGGTIYVYTGSGAAWGLQQTITTSMATMNADIHGSHIIISDRNGSLDGGSTSPGTVKIYAQNSVGTWLETAHMTASNAVDGDKFGFSVGIYDDFAVVGAVARNGSDGGVYILSRLGDTWMESTELIVADGVMAGALLGTCIDIQKDTIIVGADAKSSAYIFKRSGNAWTQEVILSQPVADKNPGDGFGYSCKIHGDTAVIGAVGDDEADTNAGASYIYTRNNNGTWRLENKLMASDAAGDDLFGTAITIHNKTVAVSADRADAAGTDSGAFYTYVINGF